MMRQATRFLPTILFAATLLCAANACFAQAKPSKPSAPAKPSATAKPDSDKDSGAVLYVPGAFEDWKPATAPQIASVAGSTARYEGYVNFPGSGEQPFKFTDAPDWTHTNYGNGGGDKLSQGRPSRWPDRACRGLL